ncbi:site-specific DNA-methyltransferase [bacterium]|jgi:DNA modification methylase|nr:site-specific DNA-methyltransferase [bacterium]MBT4894995.1 site-specific DNA-methyltransferase [bacterium]
MTLLTINKATEWASGYLKKDISHSNISYLVQYGKVKKYGENGSTLINIDDLKSYYESYNGKREIDWKNKLGNDLNWNLSFDNLREKDTTKHVHRLHPYKGKFIPQLVEYFVDNHIDEFKKDVYFKKGDILLDPFLGSGTTVVQASELGIHGIGVDVSEFNCAISRCKVTKYDENALNKAIEKINSAVQSFESNNHIDKFESDLLGELSKFNTKYFPNPDFKYKVNTRQINEAKYATEKEKAFLPIYNSLVKKYSIKLRQEKSETFLDKWYVANVRKEIDYVFNVIKKEKNPKIKQILAVILSRTIRSCRATTHSDLATLKEPQTTSYYCYKHKKICKPLFSIKKMLNRYTVDTLYRVRDFDKVRTPSHQSIIAGDSRKVNIFEKIKKQNPEFYNLLNKKKIKGIFSSPPYVGQIDYHEQHAYAYDLLGYKRNDELEIGPLYNGQGIEARKSYVQGISDVLNNCKNFLAKNYDIFLVANDKFNLYPEIAERSGMKIVNQFKRPVLNRTERDRNPYSEIIFHMKEK